MFMVHERVRFMNNALAKLGRTFLFIPLKNHRPFRFTTLAIRFS
jgi:hypothetical protein